MVKSNLNNAIDNLYAYLNYKRSFHAVVFSYINYECEYHRALLRYVTEIDYDIHAHNLSILVGLLNNIARYINYCESLKGTGDFHENIYKAYYSTSKYEYDNNQYYRVGEALRNKLHHAWSCFPKDFNVCRSLNH
jgi:hypothetical protein